MATRSFNRSDRLSAELRRLLGTMVHEAVRDSALPSMSVSDVEVTKDFDVATIFVTALLPDTAKDGVKALNELAKEFRRELSRSTVISGMKSQIIADLQGYKTLATELSETLPAFRGNAQTQIEQLESEPNLKVERGIFSGLVGVH